jgi:hypothetical protein
MGLSCSIISTVDELGVACVDKVMVVVFEIKEHQWIFYKLAIDNWLLITNLRSLPLLLSASLSSASPMKWS